jgi:transposase-like protein
MDTVDDAITKPARRLEVFTGAGRRRTWSDEYKARVVAEIETSGDSVSGVARRTGLSPQQLFGWRRQVREAQARHAAIDRHTRPTKRKTNHLMPSNTARAWIRSTVLRPLVNQP